MDKKRSAVIMAGGRGERFWPQSRLQRPKHLLPIVGDAPMLRQTVDRLAGLVPSERIWIITNQEQVEAVWEVCPEIPADQVIAEPVGRDTAPAVALAALLIELAIGDHAFAMLPADHVIQNTQAFQSDLETAFSAAETSPVIATIGIHPTFPATGYGYIQIDDQKDQPALPVRRFVEKPDLQTAEEYVADGNYFWNGGIFVWRPSTILGGIEAHCPELHSSFAAIRQSLEEGEALSTALPREYPELTKISIDYAVMEKADNVVMIRSSFDWDDVGSWPAIERHFPADAKGSISQGMVVSEESANNIVLTDDHHLIGLFGVNDLMVIHTADATLICPKNRAQDVKKLVKRIEGTKGGKEYL